MADTTTVETVTPEAPSNDATATATPVVNADAAEVERLKKEAEQAKMRANQLENELAAKNKAEAEAKAKQLEEKEEFKTLYEQTQAQLNEIKDAQAAQERQGELAAATNELFNEYPSEVVELARTAGLSLADDSDEAKTTLKEKLDAFKEKVSVAPTVTPNNPSQPAQAVTPEERVRSMAEARLHGTTVKPEVLKSHIQDLPAIKRMKELANGA